MIEKEDISSDLVYTAFITLKNGRRLFARDYGKKAFCFLAPQKDPET